MILNKVRKFHLLTEIELEQRKPVWFALSDLWLDTELNDDQLDFIAAAMNDSKFSIAELRSIYEFEVAPAVYRNLLVPAGEWAGFNHDWLIEQILPFTGRRSVIRNITHKMKKYLMLYATERYWRTLLEKLKKERK